MSSLSITWELIRNVESRAPPLTNQKLRVGPSDPSVRSAPEDPGARWAGEPSSAVRDFGGDGRETNPALRLTPGHDGEKLS